MLNLAYDAREATENVDGYFQPAAEMRKIAAQIATREGLEPDWLNDAVKRFLSPEGTFDPYLERSHLRVLVAQPEYLLAMKCHHLLLARTRIGLPKRSDEQLRATLDAHLNEHGGASSMVSFVEQNAL